MVQGKGQTFDVFADAGIGKVHVPEFDVGRILLRFRGGQGSQILGKGQHIRHTVGTGFTLAPHDKDPGDTQHGVEDHGEVLEECHNDTA